MLNFRVVIKALSFTPPLDMKINWETGQSHILSGPNLPYRFVVGKRVGRSTMHAILSYIDCM